MTVAILCSGQGGQHAGMFALTGASPAAQNLFSHAATLLGQDPRIWVSSGDLETLHDNRSAQILCVLQGLSAAATLDAALPRQRCVAGYSVGEMAAWSVAGLFNARDALTLTAVRAETMNAARYGVQGMLFVRGLSRSLIDRLLADQEAAVAIVNPGDAYVLAGTQAALERIAAGAKSLGAKRVVEIGVQVASHSHLMVDATTAFRKELAHVCVNPAPSAGARLFSSIDGALVMNGPDALDTLAQQLSQPLQWAACLDACVEAGADTFLELGPGRALTEMVASNYPGVAARSVDEFRSTAGVRAWLARAA